MSRILYLGLRLPPTLIGADVVHLPIIQIKPRPFEQIKNAFESYSQWTHLVFTSQTAVEIYVEACRYFAITPEQKTIIAVGEATANKIEQVGLQVDFCPHEETAEGIVGLHNVWQMLPHFVFWPHSALSRPVLTKFWQTQDIKYQECILYDTLPNDQITFPSLEKFEEIVFTSPSTVDVFLMKYGSLPADKKITAIGPITQAYLTPVLDKRKLQSLLASSSTL